MGLSVQSQLALSWNSRTVTVIANGAVVSQHTAPVDELR